MRIKDLALANALPSFIGGNMVILSQPGVRKSVSDLWEVQKFDHPWTTSKTDWGRPSCSKDNKRYRPWQWQQAKNTTPEPVIVEEDSRWEALNPEFAVEGYDCIDTWEGHIKPIRWVWRPRVYRNADFYHEEFATGAFDLDSYLESAYLPHGVEAYEPIEGVMINDMTAFPASTMQYPNEQGIDYAISTEDTELYILSQEYPEYYV